ncbi:uncharacterized protein SPPG_05854 [Spizellomyces punctatus DAOM BR117]|uniref:CBM21 domain-containing protein n=1 Tax=Spizellomyces punctatus (strain DAOM BR117) TaxID=645134 RepID=A0A0L0HCG4_SPIPD|nr:uncharacterized protein SPPG_05854 [Spizellomyces punctatus DAOM BR117]KNC98887.1 hypothetical protein SPPG_05854 [Spizellomyces punctatus DAOM BR117]|eukprot:XP_016606927.1 hypothetical protein SPPG_05854 [Spizellomyces punctatus DAOM BR117]
MTQQSKEQLQADSPTHTADQDGEQNAVISVLVPSDTVVTLKESLPVTTSTPALDDRPSVSLAPPSEVTEPSTLLHIPVSPAAEGVVDATCASTTITPTSKLKPAIRSRSPSSKSVRFNATAFKHILVFPRGTIPIALLTCPQFTLQDYASIDHLGSGTPPLVVRPANFTFDELSRLDSSRPVRVETVMLTLKESTKTPVLIVRIRVANWGNPKEVVIRYSNDSWTTYTETRAESAKWAGFVEGCDKSEERFSVEIPNMTPGTTVFAVRYSINGREWWDNNMGSDYKVDLAMLPNTTTKQSSSVSQPKWPSMSIWTSEYPPNVFKCAPNPVVEPVVPDSPPLPNPGRRHRPYSFWTNGDWTRDAKSGRLGCGSLPTSERSVKLQSGHSLSLSRPLYADSNGI